MDPQVLEEKLIIFEDELLKECHSYGWVRAQHCSSKLYEETLMLKLENDTLKKDINKYQDEILYHKKETERLNKIISCGISESK
tara:strand:- start:58 stop:309 length:252 start_codon:yes stop_codon:yes gene_type:complete